MTKQKHATAAVLGLALAGGMFVTASTATASAAAGQSLTTAPKGLVSTVSTAPETRPRCRWIRGHWRWDYRRGHRVWIRGHRVCW